MLSKTFKFTNAAAPRLNHQHISSCRIKFLQTAIYFCFACFWKHHMWVTSLNVHCCWIHSAKRLCGLTCQPDRGWKKIKAGAQIFGKLRWVMIPNLAQLLRLSRQEEKHIKLPKHFRRQVCSKKNYIAIVFGTGGIAVTVDLKKKTGSLFTNTKHPLSASNRTVFRSSTVGEDGVPFQ